MIPIEFHAQDSIASKIFKLYPDCTTFDTKIYHSKNNTCIDLLEFDNTKYLIEILDELVIETYGKMPIVTSLQNIINGKSELCDSFYKMISRTEISPRRILKLEEVTNYNCLENLIETRNEIITKNIQGLYGNCNGLIYKIESQNLFELREVKNGFTINRFIYSLKNDKLSCKFKSSFTWNKLEEKLSKNAYNAEIPNIEIETCYLLNDCRQNHTATMITMTCWNRQSENEKITEIIAKIKDY